MITELAASLTVGALRRWDGTGNSNGLATRLFPVILGALMLFSVWQPTEWYFYLAHLAFGGLISGSLQIEYHGWEEFDIQQLFHHWLAMLAYLPTAFISVELMGLGIICCFLSGLTHPVLARSGLVQYTEYAEFISGAFLLLPFALWRLL